jgi:hypothetical protein
VRASVLRRKKWLAEKHKQKLLTQNIEKNKQKN